MKSPVVPTRSVSLLRMMSSLVTGRGVLAQPTSSDKIAVATSTNMVEANCLLVLLLVIFVYRELTA